MDNKTLEKFAHLAVTSGVSLRKGQDLLVSSDIKALPLAHAIVAEAYKVGARKVHIRYCDEKLMAMQLNNESEETLANLFPFVVEERNYFSNGDCAVISVISDDPDAMASVDAKKIAAFTRARMKAWTKHYDAMMGGVMKWTIVAYPNELWAKKMFPTLPADKAMEKLEEYILHASRVDTPDPVKAWEAHSARLHALCKKLNDLDVETFHYKNSLGTDFVVGMPKGYVFNGGSETTVDGEQYNANIPSEEIFSAPDCNKAEGTLRASLPLVHQGKTIENIWITFKDGRVTDCGADTNVDVLKSIIDTDEGSKHLGEIALVPYDSPISDLNTLFYETLFDENASCHFAVGQAYGTCFTNGANMTKEELLAHGINNSLEHVDFMVGTKDLEITAKCRNGKTVKIFTKGNWAI